MLLAAKMLAFSIALSLTATLSSCAAPSEHATSSSGSSDSSGLDCRLLVFSQNPDEDGDGSSDARSSVAHVVGSWSYSSDEGAWVPVTVNVGVDEGYPVDTVSFEPLGEEVTVGETADSQSDFLEYPYDRVEGRLGGDATACFLVKCDAAIGSSGVSEGFSQDLVNEALARFGDSGFRMTLVREDGSSEAFEYRIVPDESYLESLSSSTRDSYEGVRYHVWCKEVSS